MTRTVIGYVRVSTEEQAASGLSLQAQRERIRHYAAAHGWELADIVTDAGWSARTLERPGIELVRRVMREKLADAVVTVKLDRLTRSVRDLHELLSLSDATGVGLVSVTEQMDTGSAAGRLMLTMLGAMAEWEREVIAERTVAALAIKRARGERVSRFPIIGREDGERGENERGALVFVRDILTAGGASLRSIAAQLAARGHSNRAGHPYHASAIKRMVERVTAEHPELRTTRATPAAVIQRTERLAAVLAGVAA
jgi:DNA invertase Pin-like site-specific DNA recombinase